MPRATITASAGAGTYPTLPVTANSMDLTLTAANIVDKNQAAFDQASMLLLIFQNTDAGAQTVTIESAPDGLNREGDITAYSLAAGEVGFFFARRSGWRQSDGYLYFEASAITMKFAVIKL
jgi:hypothetical protein